MTDLVSWALSGTQRPPTNTELSEGFDCNLPPRDLFNWWNNLNALTAGNRHLSATAIQNDPPGGPSNSDTYIVGETPTGVWVGKANDIAVFVDEAWVFLTPKPWVMVGLADRTDWRWDHTLDTPAWVQWQASASLAGPVKLATVGEVEAGTSGVVTTPDALRAKRTPYFVATSGSTKNVPNDVDTVLTQFSLASSFFNSGTTFSAGVFTCGSADAGVWSFRGKAAMIIAAAAAAGVLRATFAKNGLAAPFASAYIGAINGTWSVPDSYTFTLSAGDQVDFRAYQLTGTNRTFDGGYIEGIRIGG